jgi:hypothetical protein
MAQITVTGSILWIVHDKQQGKGVLSLNTATGKKNFFFFPHSIIAGDGLRIGKRATVLVERGTDVAQVIVSGPTAQIYTGPLSSIIRDNNGVSGLILVHTPKGVIDSFVNNNTKFGNSTWSSLQQGEHVIVVRENDETRAVIRRSTAGCPPVTPGPKPLPSPTSEPIPYPCPVGPCGATPGPCGTPMPTPCGQGSGGTTPPCVPCPPVPCQPCPTPTPKPSSTPKPKPKPGPKPTPKPTPKPGPKPAPRPKPSSSLPLCPSSLSSSSSLPPCPSSLSSSSPSSKSSESSGSETSSESERSSESHRPHHMGQDGDIGPDMGAKMKVHDKGHVFSSSPSSSSYSSPPPSPSPHPQPTPTPMGMAPDMTHMTALDEMAWPPQHPDHGIQIDHKGLRWQMVKSIPAHQVTRYMAQPLVVEIDEQDIARPDDFIMM